MVQILVSWILIIPSLLCFGVFVLKNLLKEKNIKKELDLVLVTGLMAVTVYAQLFSLFYKVGVWANVIVVVIDISIVFWNRKSILNVLRDNIVCYVQKPNNFIILIGVLLFAVSIAAATAGENVHFDTELYHAQSIRWIEEYGVVKGLGLLMRRLAYNSSFFSLQALFSFKELFGQSLRNMNGLIAFIILTYDIISFKTLKSGQFVISDALRIVSMLVVFDVSDYKSSSTDTVTMLIAVYILTKWLSYVEEENETDKFAWLCVLSVFATTLKLSAGGLLLLALYPIVKYAKEKKYTNVARYCLLSIAVAVPFFIRNYYISGWLVYPFAGIDLFRADWKMTKSVVLGDAEEISIWAKELVGNQNAAELVKGLKWVPTWISRRNVFQIIVVVIDLLMIPVGVMFGVKGLKEKKGGIFSFFISANVLFLLWFLNAPLIRYGAAWFYLNTAIFAAIIVAYIDKQLGNQENRIIPLKRVIWACVILFCIQHNFGPLYHHENMIKQVDYMESSCHVGGLGDYVIYYPEGDERTGYHNFPAAGGLMELQNIKLRTGDIKDGFAYKQAKE